jgi:FixJ family two-component response regulator
MKAVPKAQTVFLVDDDPSVLRALGRLLCAAGHKVAGFASAQEFLDRQDPEAPGCVVLDVAMPGSDGLKLQEELVRAGNRLPIVFLTGHGDAQMRERAMQAGAVAFLSKPCLDDELLAAVERALMRDSQLRHRPCSAPNGLV